MVLMSPPSACTASKSLLHRNAVEHDRTAAALTGITAYTSAGQPQVITQKIYQERTRLDISFMRLLVNGH